MSRVSRILRKFSFAGCGTDTLADLIAEPLVASSRCWAFIPLFLFYAAKRILWVSMPSKWYCKWPLVTDIEYSPPPDLQALYIQLLKWMLWCWKQLVFFDSEINCRKHQKELWAMKNLWSRQNGPNSSLVEAKGRRRPTTWLPGGELRKFWS